MEKKCEKCRKKKNCTMQDTEYGEKPEKMNNEKCTIQDMEYGEKLENVEYEKHTL